MADPQKERQRALDEAVSRAVRDNLIPLQRALDDLQQAYADLVSACSSSRPTNTLPAMLRAQASSASLNASLSVLSNFITSVMHQRDREFSVEESNAPLPDVGAEAAPPPPGKRPSHETPPVRAQEAAIAEETAEAPADATIEEPSEEQVGAPHSSSVPALETVYVNESPVEASQATSVQEFASETVVEESAVFDVANLPVSEQELHKRANRVAKVSMQDIKMLKPEEVRKGQENKDLCRRLRPELDKARKEYDRRFQKILDHPVDYFHHWLVEVLGNGDAETLGEYPYPSPVLRR